CGGASRSKRGQYSPMYPRRRERQKGCQMALANQSRIQAGTGLDRPVAPEQSGTSSATKLAAGGFREACTESPAFPSPLHWLSAKPAVSSATSSPPSRAGSKCNTLRKRRTWKELAITLARKRNLLWIRHSQGIECLADCRHRPGPPLFLEAVCITRDYSFAGPVGRTSFTFIQLHR